MKSLEKLKKVLNVLGAPLVMSWTIWILLVLVSGLVRKLEFLDLAQHLKGIAICMLPIVTIGGIIYFVIKKRFEHEIIKLLKDIVLFYMSKHKVRGTIQAKVKPETDAQFRTYAIKLYCSSNDMEKIVPEVLHTFMRIQYDFVSKLDTYIHVAYEEIAFEKAKILSEDLELEHK